MKLGECREKRVGDSRLECLDIFISYFELQLHFLFGMTYHPVSFNIPEAQGDDYLFALLVVSGLWTRTKAEMW